MRRAACYGYTTEARSFGAFFFFCPPARSPSLLTAPCHQKPEIKIPAVFRFAVIWQILRLFWRFAAGKSDVFSHFGVFLDTIFLNGSGLAS